MCRFNETLGIPLEKAEQNLVWREFSKEGAFKQDDPNPFASFLFLMERPFVLDTMLPAISAISAGHFCSLSRVILALVDFQSLYPSERGIQPST